MIGLPEIEHIKPNFTKISIGDLWVWFSYTTPVAFRMLGERRVVRVNDWGPTTGKHLNEIDNGDKKSRLDGRVFESRLYDVRPWAKHWPTEGAADPA